LSGCLVQEEVEKKARINMLIIITTIKFLRIINTKS